jgi:hypothetical protein
LTPERLNSTTAQMNFISAQRISPFLQRDVFFTAASFFFLPSFSITRVIFGFFVSRAVA